MRDLQSVAVVDDDNDILAIVELCLHDLEGLTVLKFSSAQEFLERLHEIKFDLLLSDVMMPLMTGMQLLEILIENGEADNFPIVFMTAKAQTHEVNAYKEMGADAVVIKPFDPMTLGNEIKRLWAQTMLETRS